MRTIVIVVLAIALQILAPAAVLSQVTPAASPTASPSPTPTLPFNYGSNKQLVFVLAMGGDASTRQKFVSLLTQRLQQVQTYSGLKDSLFVPEPDWGVADYISACQTVYDPSLASYTSPSGALIVCITQVSAFTESHFINRTNKSVVDATLFYSACKAAFVPKAEQRATRRFVATGKQVTRSYAKSGSTLTVTVTMAKPTPRPLPTATPPQYYISWQSNVSSENGHYTFWTPLPLLGALLSLISGYTALAATHSSSSTTTTTFPTPNAFQPPPQNGYVSSASQTNATATNLSNLTSVATGFFGSSLSYDQNLTTIQTSDNQSLHAVQRVVDDFVFKDASGMRCPRPGGVSPTVDPISMCHYILEGTQPAR